MEAWKLGNRDVKYISTSKKVLDLGLKSNKCS